MKEINIGDEIRIRCVEDGLNSFNSCVECVFRNENCEFGKYCRSSERKDRNNVHFEVVDHLSEAVALTWEDVRKIVTIADDIADFDTYRNRHTGEQEYYTEVLRRFKEEKK